MSTSTRISQPTVEPVTLNDVKSQLSIRDSVQDDIITRRISEAREWAEEFMGRTLLATPWRLVLDIWSDAIELDYPPVLSVSEVLYTDTAGVVQTLSPSAYYLDYFSEPGWLLPAYNNTWPDIADVVNAIKITYVAGYADVDHIPNPIKEAIMLTVGHWMNYQPEAESGGVITRIPLAVEQLLSPYRIIRF